MGTWAKISLNRADLSTCRAYSGHRVLDFRPESGMDCDLGDAGVAMRAGRHKNVGQW